MRLVRIRHRLRGLSLAARSCPRIGDGYGLALAGVALVVASCGAPDLANAPPEVAEDCRREVAVIMERDPGLGPGDTVTGEAGEPTDEVLDDARTAREEDRAGIAGWPEDVLLYRCLASRGVELTPEQARTLEEWEEENRRQ